MSIATTLMQRQDEMSCDDVLFAALPLAKPGKQSLRLLLVEDQASDVILAEHLLENSMPDYDWHVVDRPSVANAITVLTQLRFDVALVDLTLQDMEGADTIKALRAAAPNMPIVVYSGSGDPALLRAAILSGAQFCIEKGKTEARLVRAIIQSALEPEL